MKKKRPKLLFSLLLAMALPWQPFGALRAETPARKHPARVYAIEVHDLPNPGSVEYAPFQAMLEDHPQVRYTRYSQLLLPGLERGSLLMSIAGGNAPDILRPYEHENKAWIRQGFLEKLDPYIYRDTDGDGRYSDGADEILWEPFRLIPPDVREMILEEGHIYLVPRFQWIQFFIYRKDLFAEAGLDPEKHLETFDEMKHAFRKLTDPNATIAGAKRAKGRHGIGIYPNGWIWQGWLYGFGGASVKYLKTCPNCQTDNEFLHGTREWGCRKCLTDLRRVRGKERAAFNSPAGTQAIKHWQDLLWAPFIKCPHCREPVELGDTHAKLTFPLSVTCPHCRQNAEVVDEKEIISGCARPLIDDDADWLRLLKNGEIAIIAYYTLTPLLNSNLNPRIIGTMPFPERGPASAFHYYGVYAGVKNRPGGQDRVRACAEFALDYCAQFFYSPGDPRYLKYDKAKVVRMVDEGFYNLCSYEELVAAGLDEYAKEVTAGSREMQRLIRDPDHYILQPVSEGYSRVQQEVLGHVLLSGICHTRDYHPEEQLRKAEELANTQVFMKDEIVESLMARYRLPFLLATLGVVALAVYLVFKLLMKRDPGLPAPAFHPKLTFGKRTWAVVLLLPAIFTIALWAYYPLLRGSVMAFQDVKVLGQSRFVGLENFVRVISNPEFSVMVLATSIYVLAVLTLGFLTPVLLAILLSECGRGSVLFRVIYYSPHLLSGVVVLFIWKIFYMPTADGLFNHLLGFLGMEPVRWLQDPAINKWALALPGIWAGTGSASLVYLAALKSIDDEIYEAAELDGAGIRQKIWHVTLPSLKPLLIINFVGAFIGAFHGMGNVLILTGGLYDTNVIGLQIFIEAFAYLRFGSSTALAWILGSFLVSFTIVQLGILKRVEFRRVH